MTAAAAAARAAGVRSMCGFNYRRVPAVTMMRQLVADGRLGVIRHVRAAYLQDWIVDPQFPLVWRLQKDRAGSGALGDIGAHIIDLTQYVTGQRITGVSAVTETFVKQRPLPAESSGLAATVDGSTSPPGRSPSTTPRSSWPGSTVARWRRTRRAGSPRVARTPCGSRSTARWAAWCSTWNASTSWSSTTPPGPRWSRASTGSW